MFSGGFNCKGRLAWPSVPSGPQYLAARGFEAGKAVAVGYDEVTLHFATTEVRLFCGVRSDRHQYRSCHPYKFAA